MFREFIILNVLLVFIKSVNAIYNEINSHKTYLNKCCPSGTYVGYGKSCLIYNSTVTFSKIKVYDKDNKLSGKSFEDLFTLIPNKFKNTTFKGEVLDLKKMDHMVYLTESGVIRMEFPNAFVRWRTIPNDRFCIDYVNEEEPRFWAILDDEKTTPNKNPLIFIIATLLSCFFMLLVLIVYSLLPELRNFQGLIQMAYVFSQLMAFLLLAVVNIVYDIPIEACLGMASGLYFFFLAAICWMSVMSYDMWCSFRSILKRRLHLKEDRFRLLMYCLYAWGVPLLLTIGLVVVNTYKKEMKQLPWFVTPGIPEQGCLLQGGGKLLYFYTPMLILIICNWMFFLMTAFNIWHSNQGTAVLDSYAAGNRQAHRAQTQRFVLYIKLSVVMGLSWLLEIISFVWPGSNVWFLFDAYNSLIGVAMFLIFVCKKKIWKKLCKRCGGKKTKRLSSKSTSKADSSQENVALQSLVSSQPNGLYG